jgi:nuclear pore complex protein Nup98-Nup96
LFEGLEESDKTLEESFSLKPNAKRLIIKPKSVNSINQSLTKTLNISATSNVTHADKSKQSSSSFDHSESFNNQVPLNPIENNDTSRRTSWLQTNALVKGRQSIRGNESILENTLETLVTGKESKFF